MSSDELKDEGDSATECLSKHCGRRERGGGTKEESFFSSPLISLHESPGSNILIELFIPLFHPNYVTLRYHVIKFYFSAGIVFAQSFPQMGIEEGALFYYAGRSTLHK